MTDKRLKRLSPAELRRLADRLDEAAYHRGVFTRIAAAAKCREIRELASSKERLNSSLGSEP